MADSVVVYNAVELPSIAPETPLPEWLNIARVGRWLGHPQRPQEISRADLAAAQGALSRRFTACGALMCVDWDHQSLTARLRPDPAPAKAAAWLDRFEVRAQGDELWAHVRSLSDAAANALRAGEYRYLSPVCVYGGADPQSGEPLPLNILNVALTNTPFMTELHSAALNSLLQPTGDRSGAASGQPNAAAPGPDLKGDTMDLLLLCVGVLGADAAAVANALSLAADAQPEVIVKALAEKAKLGLAAAALETRLAGVANSLGCPADAADAVLLARVAALTQAAQAPPIHPSVAAVANALSMAPDAKPEEFAAKIGQLQAAAADARADRLIANAVSAFKIPRSIADWWLARAKDDFDGTAAVVNALPPVLARDGIPPGYQPPTQGSLTPEERAVAKQLGLSEDIVLKHKRPAA